MPAFDELAYLFRSPKYPVIVEIEGVLVAAKSEKLLCKRLSQFDIADRKYYDAIDRTAEPWTFIVMDGNAVLSPFNFKKQLTKLKIIHWFNNRKNKPADEVEYSTKSLSSKRLDRIIVEITDRLIDAEKRTSND